LIETWFLAKLGTDVLAGVAVVVPVLMLMQNMSQGAMGGGISSAVARTLGSGKPAEANHLVRHAVALNAAIGIAFSLLLLLFGPQLYRALGAHGPALDAALSYSNVIFAGIVLLWVMNAFASVIRGTGNMLVPGAVICGGAALLIPIFAVPDLRRRAVASAGSRWRRMGAPGLLLRGNAGPRLVLRER
jgi:Na+-driven multidrug efflux pump